MIDVRRQIQAEVDRMTDDELRGLSGFLATFPDRLGAVLRNAPWEDEPWTEAEEWLEQNGSRGIPHEEIVRRHGLR